MASVPNPTNTGAPESETLNPAPPTQAPAAPDQAAASIAGTKQSVLGGVQAWCDRWVKFAQVVQGFSTAIALVISLLLLIHFNMQVRIQERSFNAQIERLKNEAADKEKAIREERLRFQHAQTSRLIDDMNKIDIIYTQFPYVTEYHEKAFSADPSEDNSARHKRLRQQFMSESVDRKRIILGSCEMLANFMDAAILQRDSLDPGDWNRWWNSFMDNYDENPILQDFLEMRADWYKSSEALSDKKRRIEYYREGESKRSAGHACFQ